MKRTLLLTTLLLTLLSIRSQELKLNTLGILFNSPDISYEHQIANNLGLEGSIGAKYGSYFIGAYDYQRVGAKLGLAVKHYFKPRLGNDRIYLGGYSRLLAYTSEADYFISESFGYTRTKLAIGFVFGWKWVHNNGFLVEYNCSLGRGLIDVVQLNDINQTILTEQDLSQLGIDFKMNLSFGWRF